MRKMHRLLKRGGPMLLLAAALFLFFFWRMPYHLFHKEQTQLFLCNGVFVADYFRHPASLARLAGDYLTQYYYYIGAGPLILALAVGAWGLVVRALLRPWLHGWAWMAALAAVAWEAGRQSALTYPLSGTLSLAGAGCVLLLCRRSWRRGRASGRGLPGRCLLAAFLLAAGWWLFGCGEWKVLWYWPDARREYLLALDSETYFGNRVRLKRLLEGEEGDAQRADVSYFRNLQLSADGCLPDRLLAFYQPFQYGLFLPVSPQSDYIHIYSANEAWFALGDMTMAEHAAMLGMIFSPRHTGTRAMRRLAEINLINGDEAAALKYLRLLRQTACHRQWAEQRWPGRQTPAVRRWLEEKRRLLPAGDTLRSASDNPRSLRLLLEEGGAGRNPRAADYLLCHDLLVKDIESFVCDYRAYAARRPACRLYAEAWLVWLAARGKLVRGEELPVAIPAEVATEFRDYTRLYEQHRGDGRFLKERYGGTYWFYYHYATRKMKNEGNEE